MFSDHEEEVLTCKLCSVRNCMSDLIVNLWKSSGINTWSRWQETDVNDLQVVRHMMSRNRVVRGWDKMTFWHGTGSRLQFGKLRDALSDSDARPLRLSACDHVFHHVRLDESIDGVVASSNRCPLCQKKSRFCFLEFKLAWSASNSKVSGLFSGLFSDVKGRLSYMKIGSGRE